jgi:hypothetical protein
MEHGKRRPVAAALLLALLATGCSAPELVADVDAPPDANGLVPLRGAGLGEAWIRPGTNLSRYRGLRIEPAEFQFRPVPEVSPSSRSTATEFPVGDADRERFIADVNEALREELAASRKLPLTDERGPDVLVVQVAFLDIVSRVPPDIAARNELYLDSVGEATLQLQLKDEGTGELLARTSDRRKAEPPDGFGIPGAAGSLRQLSRTTPVTARTEARLAAQRWAATVTRRIDQLYVQGKIEASKR